MKQAAIFDLDDVIEYRQIPPFGVEKAGRTGASRFTEARTSA